jgi:hypothetical protein
MAKKTKIIHVAIEPELYKEILKAARWLDCSVSQAIRAAVKRWVAFQGETRP